MSVWPAQADPVLLYGLSCVVMRLPLPVDGVCVSPGSVSGLAGQAEVHKAQVAGLCCVGDPAECTVLHRSQRLALVETFLEGKLLEN